MGNYFERDVPYEVDAVQWTTGETLGGLVEPYADPDVDPEGICPVCGHEWQEHGWILDPAHPILCPGDWVIELPDHRRIALYPAQFAQRFEEVGV